MRTFIYKFLWSTLKIVAIAYVGVVIVLMFFENRLVFRPATAEQGWRAAPSSLIQDVELSTDSGLKIHAWWCPYKGSDRQQEQAADGAVLYCHGNAGNLSGRGEAILQMSRYLQTGVLIFDYPGYGKSEGSPTEMGCYAAADAGYAWLIENRKINPGRIVLYGGSLGGGVAVDLASRREHRALILAKTFTSVPDVGQRLMPWLPVRWMARIRFNNLNKIEFCRRPVFIASAVDDELVPFAHGPRLFEAANEPKEFLELPGGHNVPLNEEFFAALAKFLRERAPAFTAE